MSDYIIVVGLANRGMYVAQAKCTLYAMLDI